TTVRTALHLDHLDNLAIRSDRLNIGTASGVNSLDLSSRHHLLTRFRLRLCLISLLLNLFLMIRGPLLTVWIWGFRIDLGIDIRLSYVNAVNSCGTTGCWITKFRMSNNEPSEIPKLLSPPASSNNRCCCSRAARSYKFISIIGGPLTRGRVHEFLDRSLTLM